MKNFVLTLGLVTGLTGAAQAQTGVTYGVKGGFNAATFSGKLNNHTDSEISEFESVRPGFSAGGFVNFNVSKIFAIQPELLYSQKGASLDDFQGNSNVTFKSTTGHLDLPVMLRATFGRNGQFFAELGPQVSYLVSNRDFTQTSGNNSVKNTSTDDLNRVAVGYASGLGYNFSNGLSLGIRTANDISKVYKGGNSKNYLPSADLNGQNPSARNLALQLQVQYTFGRN